MKAKLYICIILEETIEKIILSQDQNIFSVFTKRDARKGVVSLSTDVIEIEYDDLGAALLEYFYNNRTPNLSKIKQKFLAYVQVVPIFDEGSQLSVYLDGALIKVLAQKHLGLDIHGQYQCESGTHTFFPRRFGPGLHDINDDDED